MFHNNVGPSMRIACQTFYTLLAGAIGGARVILWDIIEDLIKSLRRALHDPIQSRVTIYQDHISRPLARHAD